MVTERWWKQRRRRRQARPRRGAPPGQGSAPHPQEEELPHPRGGGRRRSKAPSTTSSRRWAADDLERAAAGAVTVLDETMDEHLAFARKSTLREYAESIGVAVAIALLLRAFVVEAFQIPSGSMIPTLEVGDHIFVSKFSYGVSIPFTNTKMLCSSGSPKRGDIIVFKYPLDPRHRLHQAGRGAARRHGRGPPERDLHQRPTRCPRRARPGGVPLRGRAAG